MLLLSLALATAPSLDVLVVDQSGGGDFNSVASAVAAANEGDVLLVRSGSYAAASISGKSLALVADAGAQVSLPSLAIADLASDQWVVAAGLSLRPPVASTVAGALTIENAAGQVLVERVTAEGVLESALTQISPGASVVDAGAVTFVDCTLRGSSAVGGFSGTVGREGLVAERSSVAVFGGTIQGGAGFTLASSLGPPPPGDGGDALVAIDCDLDLAGTTLAGGAGADGADGQSGTFFLFCGDGGDGGSGVVATSSSLQRRGVVDVPGAGGQPGVPLPGGAPCSAGAAGVALDLTDSTVSTASGPARSLSIAPNPVREGQTATVRFEGAPGDLVIWSLAVSFAPVPLLEIGGPVLGGGLPSLLTPGTVPAAGTLELSIPIQPFQGTALAIPVVEQALHVTPLGELVISSPSYVLHLDAAL